VAPTPLPSFLKIPPIQQSFSTERLVAQIELRGEGVPPTPPPVLWERGGTHPLSFYEGEGIPPSHIERGGCAGSSAD
jgi:hypothetical protein